MSDEVCMPMNNAEPDIESLERIFQLVTEAPESRRESLLAELCPDPDVQGLVRDLLKADSSDGLVRRTRHRQRTLRTSDRNETG